MGGLIKQQIVQQYGDVFEGLGELGQPLHQEVKESVQSVQFPSRRIPEARRTPLQERLKELEDQGVIEKVTVPTD